MPSTVEKCERGTRITLRYIPSLLVADARVLPAYDDECRSVKCAYRVAFAKCVSVRICTDWIKELAVSDPPCRFPQLVKLAVSRSVVAVWKRSSSIG